MPPTPTTHTHTHDASGRSTTRTAATSSIRGWQVGEEAKGVGERSRLGEEFFQALRGAAEGRRRDHASLLRLKRREKKSSREAARIGSGGSPGPERRGRRRASGRETQLLPR